MKKFIAGLMGIAASGFGGGALAQTGSGPVGGGIAMLPARSALSEEVHFFHNWILMPVITVICLLVLALLLWIIVRYNSKANPNARKFSHNTLIEIVWTGIPILILLYIALPSFDLLYKEAIVPDGREIAVVGDGSADTFMFANTFPPTRMLTRREHVRVFRVGADGEERLRYRDDYTLDGLGDPDITVTMSAPPRPGERIIIRGGRSLVGTCGFMCLGEDRREIAMAPTVTLKVTGYQWNWSYAYPDFGDFEFFSNLLPEDQTMPDRYLWEVDNRVVIPVGETIRVTTTARDVIHSWALPNFAVKIDAVPGRINETWIKADREGVFYGQCSEICGVKHAYMPIAVEAVSRPEFERWVDEQRQLAGMEAMFAVANSEAAPSGASK